MIAIVSENIVSWFVKNILLRVSNIWQFSMIFGKIIIVIQQFIDIYNKKLNGKNNVFIEINILLDLGWTNTLKIIGQEKA